MEMVMTETTFLNGNRLFSVDPFGVGFLFVLDCDKLERD